MSLHVSVHAAQKEMCLLNLKAVYVESGIYFNFIFIFKNCISSLRLLEEKTVSADPSYCVF